MIAKYIVLSNIISVAPKNILRVCIKEPFLISKKFIFLFHTLSAYSSLLIRCKAYLSDPRECLGAQSEGMLKPMKTLVLIQDHIERILYKNKIVIPNYQPLLLQKITLKQKRVG